VHGVWRTLTEIGFYFLLVLLFAVYWYLTWVFNFAFVNLVYSLRVLTLRIVKRGNFWAHLNIVNFGQPPYLVHIHLTNSNLIVAIRFRCSDRFLPSNYSISTTWILITPDIFECVIGTVISLLSQIHLTFGVATEHECLRFKPSTGLLPVSAFYVRRRFELTFCRELGTEIVQLVVGGNRTIFSVHKKLLCSVSEFFDKALNGRFCRSFQQADGTS
jgi:hypothetical protein